MLAALIIAIFSFFIKWPAFSMPLTGYFGSYQAINAMMAEMMGSGSLADFFIPRTLLLHGDAPGLHLLYYPFGSLAAFLGNECLGGGIPWWGRIQAGGFIFLTTIFLYLVAKRFLSEGKALLSIFLFSFFPMVMLSGISFQNEAAALFFLTFSFWLFVFPSRALLLLSGFFFSLALISRIHFVVALPAFFVYLNRDKFSLGRSALFLMAAAIPLAVWIFWIHFLDIRLPDQVMTSLFSQSGEGRMFILDLFGSAAFYKRILMILGVYWCTPVLVPFALGALFRRKPDLFPLSLWAWGSLGLILILPQKVMDHPFYLLVGMPPLAILIASALGDLWLGWNRAVRFLICFAVLVLSLRVYWPPATYLTGSERTIASVGEAVQRLTTLDARVIASHGSGPDLLYYCHRKGWPFDLKMSEAATRSCRQSRCREAQKNGYGDPVRWLEYLRSQGATHLVIAEPKVFSANASFFEYVCRNFHELKIADERFRMFELRSQN